MTVYQPENLKEDTSWSMAQNRNKWKKRVVKKVDCYK
jgi:hypothetical protein